MGRGWEEGGRGKGGEGEDRRGEWEEGRGWEEGGEERGWGG